jgi:hypothetical protein
MFQSIDSSTDHTVVDAIEECILPLASSGSTPVPTGPKNSRNRLLFNGIDQCFFLQVGV